MLIDGIITLMNADTGIAGLVSGRIYKNVLARGYQLPAIAVHRYGGSQDYEFSGPVDISEDQLQIDVYGTDADSCQEVAASVRALLAPFTGSLPDGTIVQACYLERDMDMPFLPNADSKGIANRAVLGFRIVNT
jgi:hypothetical protein